MSRDVDYGRIIGVLLDHEVRFVLIGGLAAIAHGSPFPTEDVDVTPERSRENLTRLLEALRDLGARVRAAVAPSAPGSNEDPEKVAVEA